MRPRVASVVGRGLPGVIASRPPADNGTQIAATRPRAAVGWIVHVVRTSRPRRPASARRRRTVIRPMATGYLSAPAECFGRLSLPHLPQARHHPSSQGYLGGNCGLWCLLLGRSARLMALLGAAHGQQIPSAVARSQPRRWALQDQGARAKILGQGYAGMPLDPVQIAAPSAERSPVGCWTIAIVGRCAS